MAVHHLNISESLALLVMQEKRYETSADGDSLKVHILSLKLGIPFLKTLVCVSNNKTLRMRIKDMVYILWRELRSLSEGPWDACHLWYWESVYCSLHQKMKNVIINPDTREYDAIFLEFFESMRYVKELHDFLLDRVGDLLLGSKVDLIPLEKQIEDLREKLILLKALVTYLVNKQIQVVSEKSKDLLSPLVALLEKAAIFMFLCSVEKMDEEMALAMRHKLSHLLEEMNINELYMVILRVPKLSESIHNYLENELTLLRNQIRLLECNVIYLNDQSKKLHDEMKMLETFVADLPHEQMIKKFSFVVTSVAVITCKANPILYSCCVENMKEDMTREVNSALSEVLHHIKHTRCVAEDTKSYIYPEANGFAFLDLLPLYLEQQQKYQAGFILKNQIETLYGAFSYLRSSFQEIVEKQHNEHEELGDLWTRIVGLAYQAKYANDFYLVKNAIDYLVKPSLSQIIQQVELIRTDLTLIYDSDKYYTQADNVPKTISHITCQLIDPPYFEDPIIGFHNEESEIMEYLTGGRENLSVVLITGMCGIGKTTLARKIYQSSSTVNHFDVRAWCSVSQTCTTRELMLTILNFLVNDSSGLYKYNDEQLAEMIYKCLKGLRYLIVLDGIWDSTAWHSLRRSFPKNNNGSRILITSRLQEVASHYEKVCHLRLLSDDESWELMQKKLFPHASCPVELLEVLKHIAKSCEGLPLAIVVIAGYLAKVEKRVQKWKEISRNLSSILMSELGGGVRAILELSYDHLPHHLRLCFLYISAFLNRGGEIPFCKLKQLWMAEGFLENSNPKNLEDIADDYLGDLISRSLVIVSKRGSAGGVKAFRVHGLIQEFLLEKAREESLLEVMQVDLASKFFRVYDQHRVSICFKRENLGEAKPFGSSVLSLLHTSAVYPYDVMEVSFQNFKRLRVLHLACINIMSFSAIVSLIHLRYLAVQARITCIPSSIAKLWHLQFFLLQVNGLDSDEVVVVPASIWGMPSLRHMHINHPACYQLPERFEDSPLSDNLETLSTPFFSSKEDAEKLLTVLRKLRKLKFMFPSSCPFPRLDLLNQLESVKVIFHKKRHYSSHETDKGFPPTLRKLTLLNSTISPDDISRIGGSLPNLVVLKLNGWDSIDVWDMDEMEFPKLRYLKLRHVKIEEWIVSYDCFPCLEQLVLEDCSNLFEIPEVLGDIPTLQMITVRNCRPSVDVSAKKIQEEQMEYGKDLEVYILPKGDQHNDDSGEEDFSEEQEEY